MDRPDAMASLASMINGICIDHPVRVGIDGVDACGKTMLADELTVPLQNLGRSVIRASADGFHNPSEIRHRQGLDSPQGYYEDSFNHDAIISNLLRPLGPNGNLDYRPVSFDFMSNSKVQSPPRIADPGAILLFDGVFLHRPELIGYWDFTVFVHTEFDITITRAQVRDVHLFKTAEKVRERYEQRYIPGQKIYLAAALPFQRADIIWDNNDIDNPQLTVNTPAIDKLRRL
jgi:uridine kinase